jgi:hypothetical protein
MGAQPEDPLLVAWDFTNRRLAKHGLSSAQALATRLKLLLAEVQAWKPSLGINPASFGMHSLRRGGVVAAWQAGVDIEKIKAHGRWRSDAVRVYMTPGLDIKLSVTAAM